MEICWLFSLFGGMKNKAEEISSQASKFLFLGKKKNLGVGIYFHVTISECVYKDVVQYEGISNSQHRLDRIFFDKYI